MPLAAEDWTPFRGICRALVQGSMAGIVLAVMACVFAWYLPTLALNALLRVFVSLLTVWVLFCVVHQAAGMTGAVCNMIVLAWVVLISYSQHVIFAIHGVPSSTGMLIGWIWCSPAMWAVFNIWTLVGAGFGVWMWRDGASLSSLTHIAGMVVWGSSK